MEGIKYLIFIVIAFVSVGLFLGAGELWKKFRGIRGVGFEKLFKFLVIIILLFLVGLVIWTYRYYESVNLCKDKCVSSIEGWRFSDPDVPLIEMSFDELEDCISFCTSLHKELSKEEWKSIDLKSIY